jgi:anti-sigma regulatory factor (Ser/Thr protein kinase)
VCLQRSRQLPCDGSAATLARHFVTRVLRDVLRPTTPTEAATNDELEYDAALVTAELIANAIRACRRVVSVTVDIHHRFIRIAVYDDGPGAPAVRSVGPADVAGRGLRIVDTLSARWGTQPQRPGKSVWATLRLPTRSAEHLNCDRPTNPAPAQG